MLQQSQNFTFAVSERERVIAGSLASSFLRPPFYTGSADGVKVGDKKETRINKKEVMQKKIPRALEMSSVHNPETHSTVLLNVPYRC